MEIYELRERDEVALKMNIKSTKCHMYKVQHLSLGDHKHGNHWEGGIVQVYTESMTLKGEKLGGVGEGGSEIPQCPLFCYKTLTILLNWTS